ncbi:putative eukaryotic integral membrane protein [Elsinoe fawcettii]|nr:putative eukaryotic integral membrane protein [Elsinoe fawcettii]
MPRINIPPLTRGLIIGLLTLSVLNTALRFRYTAPLLQRNPVGVPFLTIVPNESLTSPWVLATAALIEQNLVSLSASGLTLFFGGRYLERAWGSSEYAKFVAFVVLIPNVLSFVTYWVWYLLSGNELRAKTTIHGAIALEAAFLVAFKQLVPEHTVSLFKSFIRIRVKHFPAIFVLLNTISGPLLGTDTALFLGWYGFLTSWIYLRFYRVAPSVISTSTGEGSTVKGDASDTFAFSHFFPEPIQVVLAPICDQLYNTLVAIRICTPFSTEAIDAGNEQASARAEGGLPSLMNSRSGRLGGRREEAERRRALALKALDQRLNAAAVNRGAQSEERPSHPAPSSSAPSDPPPAPAVAESAAQA